MTAAWRRGWSLDGCRGMRARTCASCAPTRCGAALRPAGILPGLQVLLAVGLSLLALLAALPAMSQPVDEVGAPRIAVATMQPGEIFFERFGHNAIVVDNPAAPGAVSYNFGYFDMGEPGFFLRFVLGDMHYMLAALPLVDDLAYYRDVGRGVSLQWLDLTPAQARALAAELALNARPENARYRYDYFTDNCSTRVRDALDRTLDGALRRQMQVRSQGNTYRSEAVRLASPALWMWLGFDVGLGPSADVPNSRWEDAFVPMRLADSLAAIRLADGRPLVRADEALLPHRIAPEPAEARFAWWPWLAAGLVFGALALWQRKRPRRMAAVALAWWTLCAVVSLLMLFLWFGTAHRFGWANHNLALFNPLCLLLLPGAWRIARGRPGGRAFAAALWCVATVAALSMFLLWLPLLPQRNAHWIALLLPVQLALAAVLLPHAGRRAPRGPMAAD